LPIKHRFNFTHSNLAVTSLLSAARVNATYRIESQLATEAYQLLLKSRCLSVALLTVGQPSFGGFGVSRVDRTTRYKTRLGACTVVYKSAENFSRFGVQAGVGVVVEVRGKHQSTSQATISLPRTAAPDRAGYGSAIPIRTDCTIHQRSPGVAAQPVTSVQGLNWGGGGSRRFSDPAPLVRDPLPLITDAVPHN